MAKNKNLPAGRSGSNLEFLSKCSFCGNSLEYGNLIILEESEQKTVFHVTCAQCQTASVVFLSNGQSGIVSAGVATDIDSHEARQKFSQEAISADDVLDAHQFLAQHQGGIEELINVL